MNKVPPQNLEAEMSLLGSFILDNRTIRRHGSTLAAADFYHEKNGRVFDAIMSMAGPVDILTLSDALEAKGLLERIGGTSYLSALMEGCPTPVNCAAYADLVRDAATRRRLIRSCTEIREAAYDSEDNAETLLSRAVQSLRDITAERGGGALDLHSQIGAAFKAFSAMHENGGGLAGLSTGFPNLDNLTGGLRAGNLVIIAGRPAHGKTSLALQIGDNLVQRRRRVLFISLEMPHEELLLRIVSQRTGIDGSLLQRGETNDMQTVRACQCFEALDKSSWAPIIDTPGLTIEEIEAAALREHDRHPLDLVVVDYAQLVRHSPKEQRYRAVGRVAEILFGVAKMIHAPVILNSQLSRASEESADRRPRLSDLRESGDLEQHASLVIFVHRPALNGANCSKCDTEFIVRKNRHGATGTISAHMTLESTSFNEKGERP